MPEDLQSEGQPSLASLVGGIVNDAQQLIRQEVALARREIQDELNKIKTAALSVGVGVGVGLLGGLMLCFMLVHLLHWATGYRGEVDPAAIPLWGCYGIVGALFLVISVMLFYIGKSKAQQVDLVPRQTVETMKENVQWIKNQT
jgi:hypothetical protein